MTPETKSLMKRAAAYGIVGWMAENTLAGPRYSRIFDGIAVPFLPIYAAGGLAVHAAAPKLENAGIPWWGRAAIYAVGLSAIELAGCAIDRGPLGGCSWDYENNRCRSPMPSVSMRGCVDLRHALLWGALGLAVEKIEG